MNKSVNVSIFYYFVVKLKWSVISVFKFLQNKKKITHMLQLSSNGNDSDSDNESKNDCRHSFKIRLNLLLLETENK